MTGNWEQTFRDVNLRNRDIDTLKRWVRHKLGGYRVRLDNCRTDNLLYRGVRWPERPTRVEQISCPPPELAKLQRASRDGQPMFYASRGAPAVLYEMRARAGDLIALSEWGVPESLWLHNLGYHPEALRRIGAPGEVVRPRLAYPIPDETQENARLRQRLSMAFAADVPPGMEHRYKLSVAINELLFDGASPIPLRQGPDAPKSSRAAGTVYPSMQMRGCADNVALWPEFVHSSLMLRSVLHVEVLAADEANLSYELRTVGVARQIIDGTVVWNEELPPEIERRGSVALEGDHLVLRDGRGQIYDMHRMMP